MTSKQYGCPIEGCNKTFGSRGSVRGHISSKRTDDAHRGETGNDYPDDAIELVDVDDVQDDRGDDPPGDRADRGGADQDDGPVQFPAAPDGGDRDGDGDGEELPCGHESFDPDAAPDDPPFSVTCDTCGGTWTVTEL